MNYDSPLCLGLPPSVRASNKPQSALCALVVQTFWPLTTHWLPLKSARVTAPATSEPLPGSLNNWHQVSSPVRLLRRNFDFSMSEPCARMVAAASVRMPALATPTAPMRLNSSSTTGTRPTGRSRPCHAVGQCGAPQPASINLLRHSTRPRLGSQFASSQERTSERTVDSVNPVMDRSSCGPIAQHLFTVVDGRAEQHLGASRALVPKMRVVIPGEGEG